MTLEYRIEPNAPRKTCQECGALIAMVANPRTGAIVPVNTATRRSHFEDCTNPDRFSRRPEPPAPDPRQKALF